MIRIIQLTVVGLLFCALAGLPGWAAAQAVPEPPETVLRTPEGVTVRAVRIENLDVDGRLDEPYYSQILPITGFVQQEPNDGEPSTERTEAWVFFDDDNLYVSARNWDSQPDRMIANEMRRDSGGILQNENFGVLIDTFYDRRTGYLFQANLLGGQRDSTVTEPRQDLTWSTVWDVRTARFDEGWTIEFAIPFKSLRYDSRPEQIWGLNLRRIIRWKNEWTYMAPIPAYLQSFGIFYISLAATLVDVETPPRGIDLEVKPYAISGIRTDHGASPPYVNDVDGDVGLDVKYGLTDSLTLDATYNTDFAQVEEDTQQVNLTRFNQFFPERREFFLENQGLFRFGSATASNNTPIMFFTRRIGLNNGRPVPIAGGVRLTGRVGATAFGVLNIQSREDDPSRSEPTNFSILRMKRDILDRSSFGVMYTRRDETSTTGAATGETWGVDGLYSISPAVNLDGFYARTEKAGVSGDTASYLTRFDYVADRYGLQLEHLKVGAQFNPEVGFLRRTDFVRDFAQARFSPRPAEGTLPGIRRFVFQAGIEYIENNGGRLDFREQLGEFGIEFFNSDRLNVNYARNYEFIPRLFAIAEDVTVPAGGYTYQNVVASYFMGQQRRVSGTVFFEHGSLYGGTKQTLGMSGGRVEISPQFTLEPSVSLNWLSLPGGDFTSSVITERTTYTFTPRMFVSALTQYNTSSRTLSINARFRWEYSPGSELFVVYSDARDTEDMGGFLPVVNRAFVVKINRLFRF